MCKSKRILPIETVITKDFREALPQLLMNHIPSYKMHQNPQYDAVIRAMKHLAHESIVQQCSTEKIEGMSYIFNDIAVIKDDDKLESAKA